MDVVRSTAFECKFTDRSVKYTLITRWLSKWYHCVHFVLVSQWTKFQPTMICSCLDMNIGPNTEPCGTPLCGLKFHISRTTYRTKFVLYSFFAEKCRFYLVFHIIQLQNKRKWLKFAKNPKKAIAFFLGKFHISKLADRTTFILGSN